MRSKMLTPVTRRRQRSRPLQVLALEDRSLPSLTYTPIAFGPYTTRFQDLQPDMQTCPEGNVTFGGIPFSTPVGGPNAWIGRGPSSMTINVGVAGVSEVDTLINSQYGEAGPTAYAALEFF